MFQGYVGKFLDTVTLAPHHLLPLVRGGQFVPEDLKTARGKRR